MKRIRADIQREARKEREQRRLTEQLNTAFRQGEAAGRMIVEDYFKKKLAHAKDEARSAAFHDLGKVWDQVRIQATQASELANTVALYAQNLSHMYQSMSTPRVAEPGEKK